MAVLSKLEKLSKIDRISDLPDPLLLHILSFLPVKSAASTCSLSKRWQHLYMSLPNLDFHDNDFRENPTNFIKSVDYMLMARENNVILNRFSLSCQGDDVDADHVDAWLWRPLRYYNVQVLKLSLAFSSPYKLPTHVYICTTLQVLSLNWNIIIDVPQIFSLPRLNVLELCDVTFSSTESFDKLLINCPVLENLVIRDCACLTGNHVKIFGNALKTLRLQYSADFEQEVELEFLIDAPAVVNLYVDRPEAVEIKTQMLLLVTATIDGYPNAQCHVSSVQTDRLFRFLGMISHVRRLTLTSDIIVAIKRAAVCKVPTFHNLTDLQLLFDGFTTSAREELDRFDGVMMVWGIKPTMRLFLLNVSLGINLFICNMINENSKWSLFNECKTREFIKQSLNTCTLIETLVIDRIKNRHVVLTLNYVSSFNLN
ncbi:F-box/LRR-repeat protein At3g26922-like [Apium graveolens]|uniref:F-box/LRR-repeat protein At3g26922-like n=1 Tax=Apium graveolens TaxID=4045 RepID=UPI003D790CA3